MLNPIAVPPPGAFIREELDARGWTQRDLAYILGCPEQAVNMILSGKRGISPEMAKALGAAFDVSPELFANLQQAYELSKAREPDPGVATRGRIQSSFPVREMIKRGWFVETNDPAMLEAQLVRFFRAKTINDVPHLSHAAKKSSYDDVPAPQLAWLFRVRNIAESMVVQKFSEAKLRDALENLRGLMLSPEEIRHVPKVLAEAGVRFVIVEALPQSKIDGVCFWLDRASPVIGMSLRHDRVDNFWFVLRHEIEHVLRKDGQREEIIDAELEGERAGVSDAIPEEERAANAAAADFVVPKAKMDNFVARVRPLYYEQKIVQFARTVGVHPGIVVGQLQNRQEIPYANLRKLLVKIRPFLVGSALTDGWGCVPQVMD